MPKRPTHETDFRADDAADALEIPELEDVVEAPPTSAEQPPPNLDLFEEPGLDAGALRDALVEQLSGEIGIALEELRADIEQALANRVEARLRERLPEILDELLHASPGRKPE